MVTHFYFWREFLEKLKMDIYKCPNRVFENPFRKVFLWNFEGPSYLNTFNSVISLLFNLINKHNHLIHIKVNDKLLSDYILPVVKIFCQQNYSDWIAIGNNSLGIDINDAYEMTSIIEIQLRKHLLQSLNF
jgi:hypothetical protein